MNFLFLCNIHNYSTYVCFLTTWNKQLIVLVRGGGYYDVYYVYYVFTGNTGSNTSNIYSGHLICLRRKVICSPFDQFNPRHGTVSSVKYALAYGRGNSRKPFVDWKAYSIRFHRGFHCWKSRFPCRTHNLHTDPCQNPKSSSTAAS